MRAARSERLYATSRAGRLAGLTGDGAPYEPPERPAQVVRTVEEATETSLRRRLDLLPAPQDA